MRSFRILTAEFGFAFKKETAGTRTIRLQVIPSVSKILFSCKSEKMPRMTRLSNTRIFTLIG